MLTLGFTLPSFLLFFNTQPLPQRKIWCPVYLTFLTPKSGKHTSSSPCRQYHHIKYCEVTVSFHFFAGESQHWTPIFDNSSLARDNSSDFSCVFMLSYQISNFMLLLVHGFLSVFKRAEPHRYHCLLLYWRFCHVAQIPAQVFLMLKVRTLRVATSPLKSFSNQAVTATHYMDVIFFFFFYIFWHIIVIYIYFFIFELQYTVCWAEEFIIGSNACLIYPY